MDESTEKGVKLTTWRDNSMGNRTLRFRGDFYGFDWRDCRQFSDETIKLLAKLCDSLESDFKTKY